MASIAEDLTTDQSEKILYFQEISGLENLQICREILERNHWDMEVAVQLQFGDVFASPSTSSEHNLNALPEAGEVAPPPVNLNPLDQRVYINTRPTSLYGWASFLAMLPFRYICTTFFDIVKLLSHMIYGNTDRRLTDSQTEVREFIGKFETLYGTNHPAFLSVSYSKALNEAKKQLKFLLVYLHGDDHEDTTDFCRNTLCNDDFISFANRRLLMWTCNQRSKQGNQVSMALNETTYPFMALILLRNGRMTVIAKLAGFIDSPALISRLTSIMNDNEASLVAARAIKDEQTMTQTIRREQDEAYQISLLQDQEKERKKKEKQTKKENDAKIEQDKIDVETRLLQELKDKKDKIRNDFQQEPDSDHKDKIDILLKLPNGSRLERRFLLTDSLEVLYNFVFIHESAPDNFQIVSNFPRRVLPIQANDSYPIPPTFEEFGISIKEMLFVQNTE